MYEKRDFMEMRSFLKAFIIIVLIVFSSLSASAGTTIFLDNTIDIPDRTVTYQGNTYEIQDIGAYSIGENANISINTTDIKSFQLSLLDKNKNFMWNYMVYYTDGRSEVTMPADVVTTPGTYALAVFYQGDIMAVKPVVFSQYKMSVIPNSTTVAPGGTLHVKVRVVPDTSLPVKVMLAQNSSSIESGVNRTREGEYEAGMNIPASAYGRFSLYATIASDNMILGYPELLGVSSGGIINVTYITEPVVSSTYSLSFSMVIAFVFIAFLLFVVFKKSEQICVYLRSSAVSKFLYFKKVRR
jgi:hypothetical protein